MNEDIRNPENFSKCICIGLQEGIESKPIPELVQLCRKATEEIQEELKNTISVR